MYCEVAGGRISYEVQGEGELLVLIHGGCLDRRMWDDQFAVFDLWKAPVTSQKINPPAMGRPGAIKAPTLVVVGEGDVPDILRIAEILQNGIPGATRVIIPGTGHMLNMQKPPEFNRIVLDFLTGLSQEATR
ncbi:MAG: alpha/beta hydrolase [Bacillota bacterium]